MDYLEIIFGVISITKNDSNAKKNHLKVYYLQKKVKS